MIEIKSNKKWRAMELGSDLPEKVKADFDWVEDIEIDGGFFQYRDHWYHLGEFMRTTSSMNELSEWAGYVAEGFGFGVVINVNEYGDEVQVGRYFCRETFS